MLKVSREAVERCVFMKDPVAYNKRPFFRLHSLNAGGVLGPVNTHGDPPKAEILFGRCKRQQAIFRRPLRGRDIYRLASQMFTSETSLCFSTGTTARYQSYQNNPRAGADEL